MAKTVTGLKELPPARPPAANDAPPAAPVASADGPVPRVIPGAERSPGGGLRRYKFRCNNYHPYGKVLYLLARDEESARAEYLKATGIAKELARLSKGLGKDDPRPEAPELVVTALPD